MRGGGGGIKITLLFVITGLNVSEQSDLNEIVTDYLSGVESRI